MKRFIVLFLFYVSTIILNAQGNQLVVESKSKFNFNQTVDSLIKIVERNKWKVIIVHDLQASLMKNGKEILPVKIIEICNPEYSFNVLNKDEFRAFSSMMPCRISVYEKSDGKTYVSRINSELMMEFLKDKECKSMINALNDIEKFVSSITR